MWPLSALAEVLTVRWFAVAIVLPLGLALPVSAAAQPAAPVVQCTVSDPQVAELSGLAADADRWYAVNDGGTDSSVFVLTKDCAVERVITGDTDPYDVEDLARAADGTFWLADAGDNDSDRETVALISLTPDGDSAVHRLTYPDGAHDSEAVLLDGAGVPYLVTKNPLGVAEVYRPAGPLASPGPTPLQHVASVQITPTDTRGGPVPEIVGSVTVTGGASMADGSVIALRTYTDAYLYAVPDGDVVAALGTEPVRVPLPDEAQGEAIAFDPDGSLVSASELVGQPIRVVTGATDLLTPDPPADAPAGGGDQAAAGGGDRSGDDDGLPALPAAAVTIAFVGGILLFMRWRATRRAAR